MLQIEKNKIFQLEKGKYSNQMAEQEQKDENNRIRLRERILVLLEKNEQAVFIVVKREHQSIQTFEKLYIFHLFFGFFLTTVTLCVTCNNVTMHLLNAHMLAIEKWNAKAREWYEIRASSSEEELTISGF